jgi:hypothetical protein
MNYHSGLKQSHVHLDPLAALRAPIEVLLGVNQPVRDALIPLGLQNVMDLATSPVFCLAYEVGEAVSGRGTGVLSRFDVVPGGSVDENGPQRLADLAAANISVLRSLSPTLATAIQQALQVETVSDLGRWFPFQSARAILKAALGSANLDAATNEDQAMELVPKLGEFPTERRYYSTIVMDRVAIANPVALVGAGQVDITPTMSADFGFSAPAVGARLTFQQSWYAHGVTLGNLLHSVALAPGESTRIAVVDWSRQTSASGTEVIGETEALRNQTTHNRALSEVQDAVAHEVQSGFSHTESESTTREAGGGFGFSVGPLTLGGSASGGTTSTSADSFSTSVGSRELAASMSQQVMDATQQAASSVRNRRASIVKEVSEQEHESVSTRIIANYNHMHALTIQYYEVIEVYRVVVGLSEVERCLFVPMKLVDFNEQVISQFQAALAGAALNRRIRELLTTDYGMIRLTPTVAVRPFASDFIDLASASTDTQPASPSPTAPRGGTSRRTASPSPKKAAIEWNVDEIRRASRITASNVIKQGSGDLFLPREATLRALTLTAEKPGAVLSSINIRRQHGQPEIALVRTSISWLMPASARLQELLEVVVTTGSGSGPFSGQMTLEVSYYGALFPVTMPVNVAANTSAVVLRVGGIEAGPELLEHLRANRLHYNQAIWRSFDASTVALLLSRFSFESEPVADLIDPRPIHIAGNYLVFRMPGFIARPSLRVRPVTTAAATPETTARREWEEWLTERGLTFGRETVSEQLLPIPTGGVFAEAILGRSNAAEKLDVTRFWNWQDSPIPLQPPEIAAINMASRSQPLDPSPGQLGQPVLNIVNPTSLPNPTGLGPMLNAITNGNMFRDMAGLAATIGLAQGSGSDATSAAADAGRLAAANLSVAAQKEIEKDRIAAQLAMAAMGNPAAMGGSPKNISEMGAVVNSAGERDKARAAERASGGGTGMTDFNTNGAEGGGTDFMPGVPDSVRNFMGNGSSGGSLQDDAFNRALWGAGLPAVTLANAPANTSATPPLTPPLDPEFTKQLNLILEGTHILGSAAEFITLWTSSHALPVMLLHAAVPLSYVAYMYFIALQLHEAFTTGTRVQSKMGYCYGIMWEANGMNTPPMTFQPWAPNTAEELRAAFEEGEELGRDKFKNDAKVHNRVLVRIAYEQMSQTPRMWTSPNQRVLNLIWVLVRGDDLPRHHISWITPRVAYSETLDRMETP